MNWLLMFVISVSVLIVTLVLVSILLRKKEGNVFATLFGGIFASLFLCMLPVSEAMVESRAGSGFQVFSNALYMTFQMFTVDSDSNAIFEVIKSCGDRASNVYSLFFSISYIVAPVLTFGFLLSFIKSIYSYSKYFLLFFRNVYVFSDLNEKSITLGKDIKQNHRKAIIVFTNVEMGGSISSDLIGQAKAVDAICFAKDILSFDFSNHSTRSEIVFFTTNEDESKNTGYALKLIERYKNRNNTSVYIFSSNPESEIALNSVRDSAIKVRRVNEVRSLIYRMLYEKGNEIFECAGLLPSGDRQISAIIVGLDAYGREMLKALSWYCQMDGYHLKIDAYDQDPKAEERLLSLAPDLLSEKYNGVSIPGEAEYTITVHPGCDMFTASFDEMIKLSVETSFVFISLGNDEKNISIAIKMRQLFERMDIRPKIKVMTKNKPKSLVDAANWKGQSYRIDFVGDADSCFSEQVIINNELEAEALQRHLKWGNEEEFWRYEYNYNSSMASALHATARVYCGIAGAMKPESELSEEERNVIGELEHRRWNAYMRSEGFVFSGSTDRMSRNDLGKTHNDLVSYDILNEEEKRKDCVTSS